MDLGSGIRKKNLSRIRNTDPDPDPAQNLDADPDPDLDPGGWGRSAKIVHTPWQNPRYAPVCKP
jgi:hypothetical protein